MRRYAKRRQFALYKGERFITCGTIYEIAEETGKSVNTIRYMTNPAYKRRMDERKHGDDCLIMVDITNVEEDK